jgi:hypothetical protein
MENQVQGTSVPSFSLSDFSAADTATMQVIVFGRPTGWYWTFAGPGHPQTIEYNDARARDRLHEDRMKEQALTNGKKWKPAEESVDDVKMRNVNAVVARLVGWSDIEFDGKIFPFSPENARLFLKDPSRGAVLMQALEFIFDDTSFMKRLAGS